MSECDPGELELDRILKAAFWDSPPPKTVLFEKPELRRFEEVRHLGSGGMGEVFSARDRVLGRRVALKLTRRSLRSSDEARARFLREAQILSNLDHPNVCVLHDYIQSTGDDVLVLELIQGETLQHRLTKGLERSLALRIAEGIAAALSAAHAAGIVHRDLKPANVMVTSAGVPKVLDFGVAYAGSDPATGPTGVDRSSGTRDGTSPQRFTVQGQVLGTPAYMSPEQRRGESSSPASDLYAFGLILEELIGPTPLSRSLLQEKPQSRPTAGEARLTLARMASRPKRRALQALAALVVSAFAVLATRYVVDVRRERDHALDRQARAERLIAFLVERVASRIEDVGPKSLIEAVDEEAMRYFRGDPGEPFSEAELMRRVQAMCGYAQRVRDYGRLATAKAIYEEVERFLQDLPQPQRDAPEWVFELGQVHFYLGEIARDEGLAEPTQRYWQSYAAISESLARREPENQVFQDELAYSRTNLGVFQFERGRPERALADFSQALAHWKRRAQAEPQDVALNLEWADALSWYAESLGAIGDNVEASEAFGEEVRLREEIERLDPANGTLRHGRALAYHHLGRSLGHAGQQGPAVTALRQAQEAVAELCLSDPERAQWKRTQVLVAHSLGGLLDDLGRFEDALPAHALAQSAVRDLLGRDSTRGDWVSLSAHVLLAAAKNQYLLGEDHAAQLLLAETLRRVASDRSRIKGISALETELGLLKMDLTGEGGALCSQALARLEASPAPPDDETRNTRMRLLLRLGRKAEAHEIAERLLADGTLSAAARRDYERLGPEEEAR